MAAVVNAGVTTPPLMGLAFRITTPDTGQNPISIPNIDPEFVPRGIIIVQCVNVAAPAQAVFASWAATTLVNTAGTLTFDLWCSSGADTEFVDILVF